MTKRPMWRHETPQRPKYERAIQRPMLPLPGNNHNASPPCQASARSGSLLSSFPFLVLECIFQHLLGDQTWCGAINAPFYRFQDLQDVLDSTMPWRSVCSNWTAAVRHLAFTTQGRRNGILVRISAASLPKIRDTFPHLQGLVVNLGDPNDVRKLEDIHKNLALFYEENDTRRITAISWNENAHECMTPYSLPLRAACNEVCRLQDIPFLVYPSESDLSRENRYDSASDSGPLKKSFFLRVNPHIVDFLEEQINLYGIYHARLILSILNLVDKATYLEIPSFAYLTIHSASTNPPIRPACPTIKKYQAVAMPDAFPSLSLPPSVRYIHIITFPHSLNSVFARADRNAALSRNTRGPERIRMPRGFFRQARGESWEGHLVGEMEDRFVGHACNLPVGFRYPEGCFAGLEGWGFRGMEVRMLKEGLKECWKAGVAVVHVVNDQELWSDDTWAVGYSAGVAQLVQPMTNEALTSLTINFPILQRSWFRAHATCRFLGSNSFPNLKRVDIKTAAICPQLFSRRNSNVAKEAGGVWRVKTGQWMCEQWSGPFPAHLETERVHGDLFGKVEKVIELAETAGAQFPRDEKWDVRIQILSAIRSKTSKEAGVWYIEISLFDGQPRYTAVGWGDDSASRQDLNEDELVAFLKSNNDRHWHGRSFLLHGQADDRGLGSEL